MNCDHSELLINGLVDGELDVEHAREVEIHLGSCLECSEALLALRQLHDAIGVANLKETAPARLRNRIEMAPPLPSADVIDFTS